MPIRCKRAQTRPLVVDAGYDEYLKSSHTNWRQRLDDIEQLENFAMQFSDTTEFLTQLSLLTNVEAESDRAERQNDDEERVKLSTIHQAKGLEWRIVFLLWLAEGRFPTGMAVRTEPDLEEERLIASARGLKLRTGVRAARAAGACPSTGRRRRGQAGRSGSLVPSCTGTEGWFVIHGRRIS